MWLTLLVGSALAAAIWIVGYTAGGGLDGPCSGSFVQSLEEGASVVQQGAGPFGARCAAHTPDGQLLRSQTYPGTITWLLVLVAFVSPWLFWFRRRAVST